MSWREAGTKPRIWRNKLVYLPLKGNRWRALNAFKAELARGWIRARLERFWWLEANVLSFDRENWRRSWKRALMVCDWCWFSSESVLFTAICQRVNEFPESVIHLRLVCFFSLLTRSLHFFMLLMSFFEAWNEKKFWKFDQKLPKKATKIWCKSSSWKFCHAQTAQRAHKCARWLQLNRTKSTSYSVSFSRTSVDFADWDNKGHQTDFLLSDRPMNRLTFSFNSSPPK